VHSAFDLRPYQREALDAIHAAERRGVRRPLLCLPTGAGKTVVFSRLIDERRHLGRALVIAHRTELLTQAADKIRQTAPDLRIGVVQAGRNQHQDADVIVASIQTLAQKRRRAPLIGTIATVVVDEAHHAVADTYRETLADLGAWDRTGPLTIGVTATAGERSDGVGLRNVWEEIVYRRGILQMIADGYLTDIEAMEITSNLDLSRVQVRAGDYTDGSLGEELSNSGALEAAAHGYRTYAADLQGVAFTPTIASAHELAELLNDIGITAEALSGKTPTEERAAILDRLATGQTQVVTNCAVLTEGFDLPALSCCLLVRPTKSRPLFVQMVGRVLRPHPGKDKARLLTLYVPPGAGLATIASLAGDDPRAPKVVKPGETLAEAVERTENEKRSTISRTFSARTISLFRASNARWLPVERGIILPAGKTTIFLVPDDGDLWNVVRHRLGSSPHVEARAVSPEIAKALGEEIAQADGTQIASSHAKWRHRPPTYKQLALLARHGITDGQGLTAGEASDALARQLARPTMLALLAKGDAA
jgi:superfamily II DNA or RNA helicase